MTNRRQKDWCCEHYDQAGGRVGGRIADWWPILLGPPRELAISRSPKFNPTGIDGSGATGRTPTSATGIDATGRTPTSATGIDDGRTTSATGIDATGRTPTSSAIGIDGSGTTSATGIDATGRTPTSSAIGIDGSGTTSATGIDATGRTPSSATGIDAAHHQRHRHRRHRPHPYQQRHRHRRQRHHQRHRACPRRPICRKQTDGKPKKRCAAYIITRGGWTVFSGQRPARLFAASSMR